MSTQYRLVQSGKTASGGCSAGPRFVRACSATDVGSGTTLLFTLKVLGIVSTVKLSWRDKPEIEQGTYEIILFDLHS
jgi:hypothetical protein